MIDLITQKVAFNNFKITLTPLPSGVTKGPADPAVRGGGGGGGGGGAVLGGRQIVV